MHEVICTSINSQFLSQLRDIAGERVSTAKSVRYQHGKDESYHEIAPPDIVVFPQTIEEVSKIISLCFDYKVPVVPFGAGTSLEGHITAVRGGISIDLMNMNKIIKVNIDDLDVIVEPGVTRKQLNRHLRDTGLFFPVDPGADASLGGMAATRASGTNAVRYGTMKENVISVKAVMADGKIINTGGRAKKSSAGYDLTRLLVGSEGTLGVIVEITLKLYGIPEVIAAGVCSFKTLEGAIKSVIELVQLGIPVARCELLDEVQMLAVNRYSNLNHPVQPTLFFEFHGSSNNVDEQIDVVGNLIKEYGGGELNYATHEEDRNRLWQARHDAYYAALALIPNAKGMPTDVCVPISRLAECILETKKDILDTGILAPIVGHVGDGNFHLTFVLDPSDSLQLEKANEINKRMVLRALSMDGTCTGEHGIGLGKRDFIKLEHGEAFSVMQNIKTVFDPKNIMNPGKII